MKLRVRRRGALWAGFGRGGRAGTALDRRAWRTAGEPATPAGVLGGATLAAPPPEDTGASRRRTADALAIGLIAIATAVGSGADFTARTANPSNTFSAGSLSMENSKDGTAILNAASMKPGGASKAGVVDIKNTGSIDGVFTLSRDQLTSTDANNDDPAPFATKVAVGVVDCGKFTTANGPSGPQAVTPTCGDGGDSTLYLGSLANQNSPIGLGTYASGDKHRYQFEGSLASTAGNEYEGDSASARYVFDAAQTPERSMRVLKLLAAAGLTILLAIAVLILVPPLLGYQRYVITGGSMGGVLPRGSIAYDEVVPTERIRVGDVITYRPPNGDRLLTHRVVWIGRERDGVRQYRTRGDANPAADPTAILLPNDGQARLVFHVPLAGYVVAALSVRPLRIAAIGVPALAIAVAAFAGPWQRRRRRRRH